MAGVAAIGAGPLVRGWALAGASVLAADTPSDVYGAWKSLSSDVAVVILTSAAAEQLRDEIEASNRLTVVMP